MEVQFRDAKLDRLETDPRYDAGFSHAVVTAFRQTYADDSSCPR